MKESRKHLHTWETHSHEPWQKLWGWNRISEWGKSLMLLPTHRRTHRRAAGVCIPLFQPLTCWLHPCPSHLVTWVYIFKILAPPLHKYQLNVDKSQTSSWNPQAGAWCWHVNWYKISTPMTSDPGMTEGLYETWWTILHLNPFTIDLFSGLLCQSKHTSHTSINRWLCQPPTIELPLSRLHTQTIAQIGVIRSLILLITSSHYDSNNILLNGKGNPMK